MLSIGGDRNVMQSTTQIFECSCESIDNRGRMWWEEGASHESLKGKLLTFSAGVNFFSDFHSLYKKSAAFLPPFTILLSTIAQNPCAIDSDFGWIYRQIGQARPTLAHF